MIDILRFMYPNASDEYLISISTTCALIGWCIVSLGVLGLFMESIGQRRLFYEAFPLILCGFFFIECLGMHSNISQFFDCVPIVIPIL